MQTGPLSLHPFLPVVDLVKLECSITTRKPTLTQCARLIQILSVSLYLCMCTRVHSCACMRVCLCVCVCLVLCTFIPCASSCIHTTVKTESRPVPRILRLVFSSQIHLPPPTPHQPLAATHLLSISLISSFQKCYMNGIRHTQVYSFGDWLYSTHNSIAIYLNPWFAPSDY